MNPVDDPQRSSRHPSVLLLLALAFAVLFPGSALAAHTERDGSALVYWAGDVANDVTISRDSSGFVIRDMAPGVKITPMAGSGCTSTDAGAVSCDASGVSDIVVHLEGGDDRFRPAAGFSAPLVIYGGPGNDTLYGGDAGDAIYGGDGDDVIVGGGGNDMLIGDPGVDQIDGGPGDDWIYTRGELSDVIVCGPGQDTLVADLTDRVASDCEHVSLPPGTSPPGGGGSPGVTVPITTPVIDSFAIVPSRFAVAKRATPVSARTHRGSSFRYQLSEPGTVRIRVDRILRGRRSGGRCVAPSPRLRHKRACARYRHIGTLTRRARAGHNVTRFSGRIGKRALSVGLYRASIIETVMGAPQPSSARTARFRIVAR